jgi:rubrerythrin
MKNLKDTKTLQNLVNAFAGESQARNRYSMYATAAEKEGFEQIAALFLETADNERLHAKSFFKHIVEGLGNKEAVKLKVNADYPFLLGTTLENLKAAAAGENEEHTILYPQAADTAEEEGFPEIALRFRKIAGIEVEHEKRYLKLASNVEKQEVFKKNAKVRWKCRKCGYIHEGPEAPKICPVCSHSQNYFELMGENY